ncbi:VCBS repeat-containing protein, partial [bacterium]|nr:VCBS repeat-containing protein [bacterium]
LDGDGDIDVIGASGANDEIAWWENNSGQNFTEHVIQSNYNYAHHITAVDLDLDGDLDLLGAARLDDCVSWWENDGDEEFTLHHIDENLDGAIFTYPVDLDDDGDIDVLAAAEVGDQVVWYENDGNQNFAREIIDNSFNSVRSVTAVDFDLDGDLDVLAAAQQDDEISWWENDGDESFTKHTVSADLNGVNLALVADLDGDRDFDILGAVYYDDDVLWWENTLDPPLPMISVTPAHIEFTPVDLYNTSQELLLIANNGDADLTILDISVDNDRFSVEFDGQFIISSYESREILISFTPDTSGITEGILTVLSDDNVEGRIDVMLSGEGILPDTDVNWTRHDIINNYDGARYIHATDIDGDGDYDIVGAAEMLNEISWWRNDGEFNFERYVLTSEFNRVTSVFAIDLDEDGDVDILGSAREDNELAWWENDGDEGFTKHTITNEFEGAFKLSAVDLDQDYDLDIIAISYDGGEVGWWENDGDMGFTEHIVENEFPHGQDIMAVDIDSDGDLDLLGTSHEDNEVAWWENNGNMDFARHTVDAEFTGAKSVYAADLDDDGDMDVLSTAIIGDELSWWENDGDENWTAHSLADNLDGAMGLHAADLDFDGDIDILATARNSGIVHWWESLNGNYFIERIVDRDFPNARRLQGIDMDFDGDTDVICVGGNRISWWENGLDPTIPDIVLEPEVIDFGDRNVGLDHDLTLRLSNIGDETLLILDVVIEGEAFSSDFEHVLMIPSNESRDVTVTFSPDETTEYEGILTIFCNDPDESTVPVPLYGVGVFIPRPPQVVNPIEDQQVQLNFEPYAVANLNDVFWDPNGDEMEFGVETDNINLIAAVSLNGTLLMSSSFNWAGNAVVTVYADDGYEEERDFRRGRVLRQTGMSAPPHEVVVDRQTPNVRLPNELEFSDNIRNIRRVHDPSADGFPRRDFVTEHSFNVEVIGANDPPEWIELPDDFHIDEGEVIEFDVEGRDPEGDNLTINAHDLPNDATFEDHGEGRGSFHWQTDEEDSGYYTVRLVLTDGLSSVDALINMMVGVDNRPPEWTDIPDSVVIEENLLYQLIIRGSDPDDDRLFISFDPLDMPIAACFTDSGDGSGLFEWATEDGDEGEYLGLFTLTDRHVSVEAEVRFIVVNDNHPPVWEEFPEDIIAGIGDLIEFDVSASDPDDDYLSIGYSSGQLPADEAYFKYHGDGTGTFSWQTEDDDAGDYVLELYLYDGEFLLEEILNIRVIEMNFPPEWEELPDDIIVDEGELIQFSVRGIDRNNDTLSIDFNPGEMPIEAVFNDAGDGSGDFSWQTNHADAGEYNAIFTLSDGETAVDTLIRITVRQDYVLDVPDEYESIQAAIDMASNGDTVLVQPDTYIELIDFLGKDIVVGSLYLTTQNEGFIESTIIDADGNGGVVTFTNGEGNDAVLTGFTIQNGIQPGVGNGGGILCDDASPTITRCLIRNNQARRGGGIYVTNNAAPLISSCSFISNLAVSYGGGISINEASPIISYCIINGNEGTIRGGGIYCQDESSDPAVSFSLIINNSSTYGGGVCANNSNITIDNCTISGNIVGNLGSGVLCRYGGRAVIANSIIVNNEDDNIRSYPRDRNNLVSLEFCDIEGGLQGINVPEEDLVWGEGNIDRDPLFVDPDADDYHLTENSPCIDAGDPDAARDPDGTHADMGAYYFHHEPGAAILVVPLALNFGEIHFTESVENNLTISSVGERTLDVIDISVDGQGFTVDFEEGFSLEPAEQSLITVTFEPDASRLFLAELVIVSNDPDDDEVVVSLTGLAANEDPVWIDLPDDIYVEIGDLIEFTVQGSDPDGDDLTITVRSDDIPVVDNYFTDQGDGRGEFNWQTNDEDEGEYTLILTLSDGAASVEALILIAVNAPNQSPVWDEVPDDIFALEGDRIEFTVSGSDPDDDHLVISYDPGDLPEEALFFDQGNGSGIFIWQTGGDDAGYYSVSLSLSDGELTADTLINISVEAPNEPPVWDEVPDDIIAEAGDRIEFSVLGSDPNGDDLTITVGSDDIPDVDNYFTDHGGGRGEFIWQTVEDDAGDYSLSLTLSDGEFTADTLINIFVEEANEPPVWDEVPDEISVLWGSEIAFDVRASDPDGDQLELTAESDDLPEGWEFNDNGDGTGSFYWYTGDDLGDYMVTFTASDGDTITTVLTTIEVFESPPPMWLEIPEEVNAVEGDLIEFSVLGGWHNADVLSIMFRSDDLPDGYEFTDLGGGEGNFSWQTDHSHAGEYSAIFELWFFDQSFVEAVVNIIVEQDYVLNVPDEYETIQAAIDVASNGDTVLVDPGEYVENINFIGKDIVVGSLFLTTGDEDYIEQTVIDGDENGSVVTFENGETEDAVLVGFTIQNGKAEYNGGGILCDYSSPTISYCNISGNATGDHYYGGGIFGGTSDLSISHCKITNNEATTGGGGIGFMSSNPIISYCSITGNSSNSHSGAIYCHAESNITIRNCTISGNSARDNAGVSRLSLESSLSIINSIIWDNIQGNEYTVSVGDNSFTISYTDFEGGRDNINGWCMWGDGNIDTDPLFADPDNGDYHLTEDSPCIDAGDPDSPEDPDETRADMGAYYFHQEPIEIEWTMHIIDDEFNGARSVFTIDIDSDGDMDVLGAARDANDITWWENDGEQDFTEHTIAGNFDGAWSVYAADIDGDGDMDVLGAATSADDITWWENEGEQDFTEHTIAGGFDGPYSVHATDIDLDGDMDVLGIAHEGDDVSWWENDGEQDFTEHT